MSGSMGPGKGKTLKAFVGCDWIELLWTKGKRKMELSVGQVLALIGSSVGPWENPETALLFFSPLFSVVYFKTVPLVQGRVLQPLACLGFQSSADEPQPLETLLA